MLVATHEINPRFFYVGDKQNQYLPVMIDIGRRLLAGEFPVIDPALGPSGNYALDPQYGLYNPLHWLVALAMASADNLVRASFIWAAALLLIYGSGTCALLLRLGARGGWAAAGGLAAPTSGFVFYWLAPSWIPALMSITWLPWWLWAMYARRVSVLALLVVAVTAFLVVAGGWPFTWIFWAAAVAGVTVETWARRSNAGRLVDWVWPLCARLLASGAGAVAGAVTIVPLAAAVDYTYRNDEVVNHGFLVPNLADVLAFMAPTLRGEAQTFGGGELIAEPAFFAAWFAVILFWTTVWRREVLRAPGVLGALVPLGLTLLLTQAADNLGPLRWPIRGLAGVHLFLIVFAVAAAAAAGLRVTRGRVAGVVGTVAASGLLAWFRSPQASDHLLGTVLLLAAALVVLACLRARAKVAGVAALALTIGLFVWNVDRVPERRTASGYPAIPGTPVLDLADRGPVLALFPSRGAAWGDWFRQGVGVGMSRLTSDVRIQPGYTSVGQASWRERFCKATSHGFTCPDVARRLFETEPLTGEPWIDLLGVRTVAVHDGAHLTRWERHAGDNWRPVQRSEDFVVFHRVGDSAQGRITAVRGEVEVRPRELGNRGQSYAVDAPEGGTLVFRDLYWPGYRASLDGRPVELHPLHGLLVSVELPPDAEGTLTVRYNPARGLRTASIAGGAALLLAALGLGIVTSRRERLRQSAAQA